MPPRGLIFAVLIVILPLLVQGQRQASKSSTAFNANGKLSDHSGGEYTPKIRGNDLKLGRAQHTLEFDENLGRDAAKPHLRNSQDLKMLMEVMKSKGGVGDGGGDPRVHEFLEYGRRAVSWLIDTPHVELGISEYELLLRIWEIFLSRGENTSRLQFPSVDEITCDEVPNEVPVKGCTHSDGSVVIAGNYWNSQSTSKLKQCNLALTELLRPQKLRLVYQIAPQICERLELKNEIQSVPKSGLVNPIPRIASLAIDSMNRNYDRSDVGLDLTTRPLVPNTVLPPIVPTIYQKLYDSPANGPQHEWIDHISGMNIYPVHYSEDRQSEFVDRPVFFNGFIKMTKVQPRTIRFKGKISGTLGTAEQIPLKNGSYQQIKHGIWPTTCDVTGEFDFVESSEAPGFYQLELWGEQRPYCTEDSKNPFVGVTDFIYQGGKKVFGASLHGKIGFWTK